MILQRPGDDLGRRRRAAVCQDNELQVLELGGTARDELLLLLRATSAAYPLTQSLTVSATMVIMTGVFPVQMGWAPWGSNPQPAD